MEPIVTAAVDQCVLTVDYIFHQVTSWCSTNPSHETTRQSRESSSREDSGEEASNCHSTQCHPVGHLQYDPDGNYVLRSVSIACEFVKPPQTNKTYASCVQM